LTKDTILAGWQHNAVVQLFLPDFPKGNYRITKVEGQRVFLQSSHGGKHEVSKIRHKLEASPNLSGVGILSGRLSQRTMYGFRDYGIVPVSNTKYDLHYRKILPSPFARI